MINENFRVLLLDEQEKACLLIRHLLSQIKTAQFELIWETGLLTALNGYDAYLVSDRLLIKNSDSLDSLKDKLASLLEQGNNAPLIILTDNSERGIEALEGGASDYLEWEELSVSLLERSLRLTLIHAKGQKQLQECRQQIQHQEQITERKQIEKQLRQREGEFRALVENSPDVILQLDRECRYLYVNPTVEKNCGIPASAFIGKTNKELGFPDDLCELWERTVQEVVITEKERQIEYSFALSNQITYWFSRVVPEFNPQGLVETVLVVSRDVTKLKQTETALRQSEERLRLLTDALPVCISYVDTEQRYRFVNKSYETYFGYPKEEILGKQIVELIGSEAYEVVKQNFERAFTGEKVVYEASMPYPDKKNLDVRGILVPEFNAQQQVTGCYVLIIDVSEQQIALRELQQTEAALRQSEARLRLLTDSLPVLISYIDREQRYRFVNKTYETWFGCPREEILGKQIKEFIGSEAHEIVKQNFDQVFTGEKVVYETPMPYLHGKPRDVRGILVPEFNAQQQVTGCYVLITDISEQQKVIRELKQTAVALRQSEERLRLLTDALPVCISYIDREQRYRFVNKTYETWFECPREEILGKRVIEVIGEQAYQMVREKVEKVLQGEKVTYEARIPYPKGKLIDVESILVPEFNAQQQVTGCYALISDISKQKIALEERQGIEEKLRYRLTLETAVTSVSRVLATYDQADFNYILQLIGVAAQASRAYIIRFDVESSQGSMIYEWCDDNIEPNLENFQNIAVTRFPWWMEFLNNNQNIVIEDINALPPEAEAEKQHLQSKQTNTLLAIPIFDHAGQLWASIGFDTTSDRHKMWSNEDAQLLRVVGDMIYRHHERLEAKEQLQTSEALYSGIFNNSAEAIFLVKVLPDGHFVYETMNPAYEQATGIALADFVGKTPGDIFPPKLAAQIEANYRSCRRIKETILYEKTLDLPSGKRTWRTNLVPITDSQGNVIRLQGSASDITKERKALEEQVRYSRYQRLLATLTLKIRQSWEIESILQTAVVEIQRALQADRVLFYRFAEDGTGKIVNEAVLPGFPVTLNEEILDRCYLEKCLEKYNENYIQICSDVATAQYQSCYQELLEKYQIRANVVLPIFISSLEKPQIEAGGRRQEAGGRRQEAGGRRQEGKIKFIPSSPSSHTPTIWGLLCVQQCRQGRNWTKDEINLLRQLTDQLTIALAQAQLREQEISQRQELARSNADLEHFAYIASHDLRQPLQIIGDFAILLQRRYQNQIDERSDRYIQHIVGGVQRMDRQIQDLLEYSRVGSRGNPLTLTDCNQVLRQALHNLQIEIRHSQAIITLIDSLPKLKADASQLVQLFQNLISNGIKYHSDVPPVIKIGATLENDHWLFSISDNGIGIEPKYSERIFQIFQRLHTQEEYPGTGIGLAICQRIIQRHGGRIWVNSQLGQGSTFYFLLSAGD